AQIVSVLKSIESLPPGLYGMQIHDVKGRDGKIEYEVEFHERQLEDIAKQLNRLDRADEKPFEAVAALSEFNQRAYELFAQPLVQSMSNEVTAKMLRQMHPLRFQRWAFSDLNPWLAWLGPAAQAVKAQRQAADPDNPGGKIQKMVSEAVSASLDYYREVRDATSEAKFFQTYGNVFSLYLADKHEAEASSAESAAEPRELPFVKEALASIEEGGFEEALARVGSLLARRGAPLPLARLALKHELATEYRHLLPDIAPDAWRRIRGEQDIVVRYEPEKAIATLPKLLSRRGDRDRLVTLVRRLLADERMRRFEPTTEQLSMLENIGETLDVTPVRRRVGAPTRKAARKPVAKRRKSR
ncbi:MAG: DUF3141 domain-containing protein, partial [Betaproteobacteria bacterium]|nr:DUF3141 domain-containing protein [Betaproteobacteria bacterium]